MSWLFGVAEVVVWIGLGILSLFVLAFCWAYLVLTYFRHFGLYRVRVGPVAGYTIGRSFHPDETIGLHIHSSDDADVCVYRLGMAREDTDVKIPIGAVKQSKLYDRRMGMNWTANVEIEGGRLEPGFHVAEIRQRLDTSASFRLPVIVRPPQPREIAVILPTNTWEAYNTFAGISAYENHHFDYVAKKILWELSNMGFHLTPTLLPWARPNTHFSEDLDGHLDPDTPYFSVFARNNWSMLAFLERAGYDYGVYSDLDFAFLSEVRKARLIIFAGHSEYWPDEMFGSIEQYLSSGGHMLVTVSCIMLGRAKFYDHGLRDLDPDGGHQSYASSMVGTCVTELGQHSGAAPFRVDCANHWIFEGTGLADGDLFGRDGTALGMEQEGASGGASGHYQNKIGPGCGEFKVLATGTNPIGPAQMVYRDTEAGGWVFNTSSPTFVGTLSCDEVTSRIFRNVIDDALGKSA